MSLIEFGVSMLPGCQVFMTKKALLASLKTSSEPKLILCLFILYSYLIIIIIYLFFCTVGLLYNGNSSIEHVKFNVITTETNNKLEEVNIIEICNLIFTLFY